MGAWGKVKAGDKVAVRRKRASSQPRGRHRPLRSLNDPWTLAEFVRNLQEGVYITADDGRILDANRAFLHMFGVRSLRELARTSADQLYVDPGRRQQEAALLAREGAVREFEFDIQRPDGQIRTVLDTAYQVTDPTTGETLYHGILIDITDRKELERQLLQAALRDPLTGCFNRRHLLDLTRSMEAGGREWGVVVIDVDHFKEYNDRYGHATGDRVLVRVARFLMSIVRSDDCVLRIGGDEFLLVFAEDVASGTREVARRLRGTRRDALPVSLSFGAAVRERGESLEETIQRADSELLRSRASKRKPRPPATLRRPRLPVG